MDGRLSCKRPGGPTSVVWRSPDSSLDAARLAEPQPLGPCLCFFLRWTAWPRSAPATRGQPAWLRAMGNAGVGRSHGWQGARKATRLHLGLCPPRPRGTLSFAPCVDSPRPRVDLGVTAALALIRPHPSTSPTTSATDDSLPIPFALSVASAIYKLVDFSCGPAQPPAFALYQRRLRSHTLAVRPASLAAPLRRARTGSRQLRDVRTPQS